MPRSSAAVAESFARYGYVRVDTLVRPAQARTWCAAAFALARRGEVRAGDEMVPGTPARYGAPVMDGVLRELRPAVEALSGLRLLPTYSYFRIYQPGDVLHRHRDRPACEISVSLCLGQDLQRPWPLWIDSPRGARPVSLGAGDAVLYRGMECEHWRHPFRGRWLCQVFLHYVDRDGPHARWKYDGRARLGQSSGQGLMVRPRGRQLPRPAAP